MAKEEQEDIYKLLVKYKEVFSLREEISTCPNIEVDLQVINKSPLFIRLFHVKEEDTPKIYKEMHWLVHLGILKKDMSPYFLPIMPTDRKNSSLKRTITVSDFLTVDYKE